MTEAQAVAPVVAVVAKPAKPAKPAKAKAKAKPAPKKAAAKKAKPAPKKAAAKRDPNAVSKSVIPLDVAKQYVVTKAVKTPGGHPSIDNADEVAVKLRGKDLDTIYGVVAKKCEIPEKELRAKYAHLNKGMQRMNLGNRLRAALA